MSDLEERMHFQLKMFKDIPKPEREYKFHPGRRFRFDFAWPDQKLALEVEGGTHYGKSRHTTGTGFNKDCEKYNEATILGWRVIRVDSKQVKSGQALEWVERALEVDH